jgi:hypothetical protein
MPIDESPDGLPHNPSGYGRATRVRCLLLPQTMSPRRFSFGSSGDFLDPFLVAINLSTIGFFWLSSASLGASMKLGRIALVLGDDQLLWLKRPDYRITLVRDYPGVFRFTVSLDANVRHERLQQSLFQRNRNWASRIVGLKLCRPVRQPDCDNSHRELPGVSHEMRRPGLSQ